MNDYKVEHLTTESIPRVSVIVPAYNAEKYLGRCLDSILAQEQKDFEVIVINDGSTDGTAQVCDEYAAKDSRIKAFHKENGGASSARNAGLEKAQGKWITFIDSDDRIEGLFFPKVLDDQFDVYMQDLVFFGEDGPAEHLAAQIVSPEKISGFLQDCSHWDLFRSICCKFIKNDIVNQYHIRFDPSQRMAEDTLFYMDYFCHCRQINVLNSGQYVYYRPDKTWQVKYRITLPEVLSFFQVFLNQYDRLSLNLPRLVDFEYSFFSSFLDEKDKEKNAWRFSKAVLRMKELRLAVINPPLQYRIRLSLLKKVSCLLNYF